VDFGKTGAFDMTSTIGIPIKLLNEATVRCCKSNLDNY
jgi:hypothetical protein